MLKLVLPKGSLEKATLELFEAADLHVVRTSPVDYSATIADPRIDHVRILRPQEIPVYVAEGLFDLGITGRDWVEETSSDVVTLGELRYSKATSDPIRMVVAVSADSPVNHVSELGPGVRVSSEYPELTRRYFAAQGVDADVRLSYGASEAKIPDIADCVVEITETGRALRAAGLKVIDTILTSYTEVIANPAAYEDPDKRHAMGQLMTLLNGALDARDKVLLKLNVSQRALRGRARGAAVGQVTDGGSARQWRLRGRERCRQAHDQPHHPRAQRRRGHRPVGDPDLQDRPVNGTVIAFDDGAGFGTVATADGATYRFHCVEIADGSRTIAVGTPVEFDTLRKLGAVEAACVRAS